METKSGKSVGWGDDIKFMHNGDVVEGRITNELSDRVEIFVEGWVHPYYLHCVRDILDGTKNIYAAL